MTDLSEYGSCTLRDDGCATCGDVAVPVRVLEVENQTALCEDQVGQQAEIAVNFVPGLQEGEIALVHMGVAIGRAKEKQ